MKRFSRYNYVFVNLNVAYRPTPGKQSYFWDSLAEVPPYTHDSTLDFANAFLSRVGVNSQAELVPSPWANAQNGAVRLWLGD